MLGYPRRFVTVAWGEIQPSDLTPQGDPETLIEYRHEHHLGLHIKGAYAPTLGMLAIRCEAKGQDLIPISMAIADAPIQVNKTPKWPFNRARVDVDHWRERGA